MSQAIKYKYYSLEDLKLQGEYNFFGIIYDASIPYQDNEPNTYICTLKIIDPQINKLNYPDSLNDQIVNVIIKSNTKDNLPYVHNFGDILRVQRGKYTMKKRRTVYLNLTSTQNIRSTWTIFPSNNN